MVQLSETGKQRRLGLIGAKRTTITVHRWVTALPCLLYVLLCRSEEVIPASVTVDKRLIRQGTSVSSDGEVSTYDIRSVLYCTLLSRLTCSPTPPASPG